MCYAQSATRLRKRSVAGSGSHIRPKSVGELAHQRRGRDIFAKGEIPGIAHKENRALPPQAAESGSHSPLLCSGRPMVAPTVRRRACEYSPKAKFREWRTKRIRFTFPHSFVGANCVRPRTTNGRPYGRRRACKYSSKAKFRE